MTAISPAGGWQNGTGDPVAQRTPTPPELEKGEPERSHRPLEWRSHPFPEGRAGIPAVVLCLAVAAIARVHTAGRPPDAETLVATLAGLAALVLALLLGILMYGCYSLRYRLSDDALSVTWLWGEEVIPLAGVEAILRGTRLGAKPRVGGLVWRGHRVGTVASEEIGPVKIFGTGRDLSKAMVVATAGQAYALTPAEMDGFRDALIQRLEGIPETQVGPIPETLDRRSRLPRVSPFELRRAVLWTAATTLGAMILWGVLQIPMDVPDASSPPAGNAVGDVNDWTSVGQSFQVRSDGLDGISVVLAAAKLTDQAEITLNVRNAPRDPVLRTVRRTISLLPEGDPMKLRPGSLQERWESFDFEPIPDTAGRQMYFTIEGKGVPRENTVRVMMFYSNQYPYGEAFMNQEPVNAHIAFRASTRGRVADLITVLSENLTRNRPGPMGNPLAFLTLGLLYAGLGATLARTVKRIGKQSPPPAPLRNGEGGR